MIFNKNLIVSYHERISIGGHNHSTSKQVLDIE